MSSSSDPEMQPIRRTSSLIKPARLFDIFPPPYSLIDNPNFRCVAQWYNTNIADPPPAYAEISKKKRTTQRHQNVVLLLVLFVGLGSYLVLLFRARDKPRAEQVKLPEMQLFMGLLMGATASFPGLCLWELLKQAEHNARQYVPLFIVLMVGVTNLWQHMLWLHTGDPPE